MNEQDCSTCKYYIPEEEFNLIDMVSYLGYSKEGREKDTYPMYEEQEGEE